MQTVSLMMTPVILMWSEDKEKEQEGKQQEKEEQEEENGTSTKTVTCTGAVCRAGYHIVHINQSIKALLRTQEK